MSLERINRLFREVRHHSSTRLLTTTLTHLQSELLDELSHRQSCDEQSYRAGEDICIRNARFTWTDTSATAHLLDGEQFCLSITDEVRFKGAGLNLIHGPTACGKTSLLMALLGMCLGAGVLGRD